MANHASSKKRVRRTERRTLINKNRRSRMRTFVKKIEEAIENKDAKAAETALVEAQPEIHRSVSKGVMHKNTAARKISRLSMRIKALKEAK